MKGALRSDFWESALVNSSVLKDGTIFALEDGAEWEIYFTNANIWMATEIIYLKRAIIIGGGLLSDSINLTRRLGKISFDVRLWRWLWLKIFPTFDFGILWAIGGIIDVKIWVEKDITCRTFIFQKNVKFWLSSIPRSSAVQTPNLHLAKVSFAGSMVRGEVVREFLHYISQKMVLWPVKSSHVLFWCVCTPVPLKRFFCPLNWATCPTWKGFLKILCLVSGSGSMGKFIFSFSRMVNRVARPTWERFFGFYFGFSRSDPWRNLFF